MFGKRIKLFSLLGFKVNIDLSWVFLAVLITWSLATGVFPELYVGLSVDVYWSMGVVGAVGLFASIIFHELSHSLVARRYDIPITGITLFIFGGVAEMTKPPGSPKAEFWMAIAGPIASFVLSGGLLGLHWLGTGWGLPLPILGVLQYLGWINGILAIFNLIPAFPLDGGRVFRAILWHRTGDIRKATKTAAGWGSRLGLAFMIAGVYWFVTGNIITGIWWFLIGQFMRTAAAASYREVHVRRVVEGVPISRFMVTDPVVVPANISVQALVDDYFYTSHHQLYPVVDQDRLYGAVTLKDIQRIPATNWADTMVGDIAAKVSPVNTIDLGEDAMSALSRIRDGGPSRLLVVHPDGRLAGVLTLKDMTDIFTMRESLKGRR